jgi:CRISPR-associated protein Csm1
MTEATLWLASLLHDIGKFRQRTVKVRPFGAHEEHGRKFVEEEFVGYFAPCGDDLAHAIAHHHRSHVKREIEKQVIIADRLSATEREREDRAQEEPSHAALDALLSRSPIAPQGTAGKRFRLSALEWEDESRFFPTDAPDVNPDVYAKLWQQFRAEFARLADARGYQAADFATIVALLRKYTSRMPAATPWEGQEKRTVPDISLYDHLKTTAAIAACLYHELGPDDLDLLMSALIERHSDDARLDKCLCALVKGDISGTQDFLYLLTSSGAARGLRGRSFYLQLLTETIAHWILRQLNLPVTNLLFAGGGHFYLLLPYRQTQERIDGLRHNIADKLWKAHRGDLSLTVEYVPVTARDFLEGEGGGKAFAEKWGAVSQKVNVRKQRKWRDLDDDTMLRELFTARQHGTTAEEMCQVCHGEWVQGVDRLDDGVRKCRRCDSFEELGQKLRDPTHLVVFTAPETPLPERAAWHDVLKGFGAEVWLMRKDKELPREPNGATAATVYTFDSTDFLNGDTLNRFRWGDLPVSYDFRLLADATPVKRNEKGELVIADFSDLAEASQGVKWLGVLRMDVDSLGDVFKDGLGDQATISRMSTLSESLRLFFEGYVPRLCQRYNPVACRQDVGATTQGEKDRLYLIYAGGDDLFVVGAWSALPELAKKIRDDFRRFVGGNHVTLSGGIAIEHQKYPLYQLANDAKHALDDEAKELKRKVSGREVKKDALCFLRTPMGWEQFECIAGWKDELLKMLKPNDDVTALPHAFLTRLTEIHALYVGNRTRKQKMLRGGVITAHAFEELVYYDKWQWRLVYQLSRFGERYKHFAQTIENLQRAITENRLIDVLHVLSRWMELLTREG